MTTKKLKVLVYLTDETGYITPMTLKFPREWTFNQRETFVNQLATVLEREVTISSYDQRAYHTGMTDDVFDRIGTEMQEFVGLTREDWEAWDFNNARGDV
jgi:hypothetical protein